MASVSGGMLTTRDTSTTMIRSVGRRLSANNSWLRSANLSNTNNEYLINNNGSRNNNNSNNTYRFAPDCVSRCRQYASV